MIDWLYTLPEPLVMAWATGIMICAMVILPRFVQRLPFLAPSDFNTDCVIRVQTTLFTMTSLVLAFTLVQADKDFREADSLVQFEASQINNLDRLLTRYNDPAVAAIRPHLLTYAKSIVKDEWPAMVYDRGSPKTQGLYVPVAQGILAIEPATPRQTQIYAEMLKALDAVAETRDRRLNSLTLGLPDIYWQVVLFSVLMVVLVSSTIEQTPFRMAILASQAAVLGAFVGFVFLMDAPFKGKTAVDTSSIVQVIAGMEARTK